MIIMIIITMMISVVSSIITEQALMVRMLMNITRNKQKLSLMTI